MNRVMCSRDEDYSQTFLVVLDNAQFVISKSRKTEKLIIAGIVCADLACRYVVANDGECIKLIDLEAESYEQLMIELTLRAAVDDDCSDIPFDKMLLAKYEELKTHANSLEEENRKLRNFKQSVLNLANGNDACSDD